MSPKRNYFKRYVPILIFLIGLISILTSIGIIWPIIRDKTREFEIPPGVTILSSTSYPESLNRFIFLVYDFSLDDSSANFTIAIDLTLREEIGSNDTFVMIIPYKVSYTMLKIIPLTNGMSEIHPSTSTYYRQDLECSFISLSLNPSIGKSFVITGDFTWNNCIKQTSFDIFNFVLPLGYSDINITKETGLSRIIDPTQFEYVRLSISDPLNCRPILYNPPTKKVHSFNGKLWNSWILDLKSEPESLPLSAVRVEYLSHKHTGDKEFLIFFSGGLLGTGVSIILTELINRLKKFLA